MSLADDVGVMLLDRETIRAHARERLAAAGGEAAHARRVLLFRRFLKLQTDRLRMRQRMGLGGREAAAMRSYQVDQVVIRASQVAAGLAGPHAAAALEQVAVVALGGYGRAELAPFSDVELLFLHGGRPGAEVRSFVEQVLLLLWDSGLTVGQSIRSTKGCLAIAREDLHSRTALTEARLVTGSAEQWDELLTARDRLLADRRAHGRRRRRPRRGDRHRTAPRQFDKNGKAVAIPGHHHIPMAIVGTFILAFGWFGFNPGSTLAGTDLRIGVVATNTMLASAGGALTAMIYIMWKFGKPDPSMMAYGMLAGLVAITARGAFVTAPVSVLIGAISGVLVCGAVFFIEGTLKIDDPVGAISVHGVKGAWGVLALGLFADGRYGDGWNGVPGTVTGLFYGDARQFVAQLIGTLTCFLFVFVAFYVFFKLLDKVVGNRVSAETELLGLDMPEMGALAYSEFSMTTTVSSAWPGAPEGG
jgi:hypothetical protein